MRIRNREIIRWALVVPVIITLTLGWTYPLLGFIVPATMLLGIFVGAFRGRYVCGNLCPRGAFLDKIIAPISFKRRIPKALSDIYFRWTLFILLMGLMTYRILLDPTNIRHWGSVFVLMCFVTTVIAVAFGVALRARTWCAFCPMGTMQMALGAGKYQLRVDKNCVSCNVCSKACPFEIKVESYKKVGKITDKDCLKCYKCISACPKKAIKKPIKRSDII